VSRMFGQSGRRPPNEVRTKSVFRSPEVRPPFPQPAKRTRARGVIPMNSGIQPHLGLWTFAGMAFGFLAGRVFPGLILQPFIPVALFVMLFPAMLGIELHKIRQAMINPKLLVISQFLNFIVAPVLIFLISRILSLHISRGQSIGAIIFALIPCGGMVPAYTSMVNGNVNLAVCIVAFSLILSIGIVPLWLELLAGESIRTPIWLVAQFLAACIILPIVAAWLLRKYIVAKRGPGAYGALKKSLKNLSVYGLIFMVFIIFASNGKLFSRQPWAIVKIVAAALLFFVGQITCSMLLAKAARASCSDSVALVISSTARNTALAMALAVSYFGPETSLFIAVAGPLVQLPGMLVFLKVAGFMLK